MHKQEISELTNHYKNLFQALPQPVLLINSDDLSFININKAALELYGYSEEEFLNLQFSDLTKFDETSRENHNFLSNGKVTQFHIKKDKSKIKVELQFSKIAYQKSEAILISVNNVKTGIPAEVEELDVILRSVSDGITVQDTAGRLVYANDAAAVLCGYSTASEFLAAPVSEIIGRFSIMDENGAPFPMERLPGRLAMKGVPNASAIIKFTVLDTGDERWSRVEATPVFDEYGNVRLAINVFHDITEQRKAEEQIKISETRFRLLVEQSPFSKQIISPEGYTLKVNKAWEKLFGARLEDLAGYNLFNDPQLIETGTMQLVLKALDGERSYLPPRKYIPERGTSKGKEIWVQSYIYPVKNPDGSIYEIVLIHEDITERKLAQENFEQEYAFRKGIENAVPEGIAIVNLEGKQTYVNPAFCRILGWTEEELINKYPPFVYWPAEEIENINHAFETVLLGKTPPGGFELRFVTRNGDLIDVRLLLSPIKDNSGTTTGWLASMSDITESKRTENNLRITLKELSDYKYALDESSIIAITDQKGIIKHANENFCKISKYTREELLGKDHRIINSGYHSKEFIKNLWRTIAGGKIWKGELRNRAKDASIYWVDTTIVPFLDEQGKPYQYVAIRSDITQRKFNEEVLRKSEEKYRTLVEGTNAVLFTADKRGIFTYANEAAASVLNAPLEEIIGKFYLKFVHPKDRKRVHRLYSDQLNAGKRSSYIEFRYISNDNIEGWVSFLVSPVIENGVAIGMTGVAQDITERKAAEEKIAASLKEKDILLKEVHHRVKNNMQVIYSLLNLQSSSIDDEKILTIFKESQNRIRTMALIHEKLYQSKEISNIDLPGYINELVSYLVDSYLINVDRVNIHLDTADIEVNIDIAISLGLIINELVSNAIKYAFPNNRKGNIFIRLKAATEDDLYRLIIYDDGVGLPNDYNSKISNSLGLQLVNTLVEQLEGFIETEMDNGTRFTITFPFSKPSK